MPTRPGVVSAAIGLVHDDAEARSVLERELRSTLDGLDPTGEAFAHSMRAAEDAAALAARDEATAGPAQRRSSKAD